MRLDWSHTRWSLLLWGRPDLLVRVVRKGRMGLNVWIAHDAWRRAWRSDGSVSLLVHITLSRHCAWSIICRGLGDARISWGRFVIKLHP